MWQTTSHMSQLSATGTLWKGIPTTASNLYVLSCIGSQDRGMPDTVSKDPGKKEPEQPECSMDFIQRKGGWMKYQHSHPWRNKERKRHSLTRTCTELVGEEGHQTKEAVRCGQIK